jgi:phage N-6-adenine-methyltransferase
MSNRKMPAQKRGESKQDYSTPKDFLSAVEARFGPITFDLAANGRNKKHARFFSPKDDSLVQDWSLCGAHRWLNPEFGLIAPWARKCAETNCSDGIISLLTPAAVGADWFSDHVHGKALVLALNGRLSFDGVDLYPKDCMLSVFGLGFAGFEVWDWRKDMTEEGRRHHAKQKRAMAVRRAERKAAA